MSEMQKRGFTIHDLPKSERPRERLQKHGPEALSSQELLALLLGRGIKGESVMVTAQRLLSTFGNIENISQASLEELSDVKCVGPAKASQIKAAFELARRKEDHEGKQISVKSHQDVIRLVKQRLKDKKKEHFLILCLDTRNNLIKISTVDNFIFPVPPFDEQKSICSNLIQKTAHIDGSIKKIKSQIETLKEYRQTLISNVVTGKVKINEDQ